VLTVFQKYIFICRMMVLTINYASTYSSCKPTHVSYRGTSLCTPPSKKTAIKPFRQYCAASFFSWSLLRL